MSKPAASTRIALVIGNARYTSGRSLRNTRADADGLAIALSNLGFSSHIRETSNLFCTLRAYHDQSMIGMKRLLADFSVAAQDAEMAIIYYSGHGIEVDFRSFLIPVDAELGHVARIEYETIALAEAIRATNGAERLRLVILDACRDNPFLNRMKGVDLGKTMATGIGPPSKSGSALTFYAATEGQIAREGPEGGMSPFAEALVRRLREPNRELLRIFGKVTDDVRRATAGAQEPRFYGPPPSDELYLAQSSGMTPEIDVTSSLGDPSATATTAKSVVDEPGFERRWRQRRLTPGQIAGAAAAAIVTVAIGMIGLACVDGRICAQKGPLEVDGALEVKGAELPSIPLEPMKVEGAFAGSGGARATDISGIACMPAQTGQRTCLVIDDENKNAQFATIRDDRIIVGPTIPLIGSAPDSRTLGSPPDATCVKADDFRDLDGEAVAYSEPYFYVVGSHGCGRSTGKSRLSSFILARVRVNRQGQPIDSVSRPLAPENFVQAVETTYRVSDWLRRSNAAAFFGQDLESGLYIEGVAARDNMIWFGLRAPVNKDAAFLIGGDPADLFRAGNAPSVAVPKVIRIKLEGLGVRDLAPLPDKRLLVLGGVAQQGPVVPYKLFVVDPTNGTTTPIGPLAAVTQQVDGETKTGKAEGLTVLEMTANKAKIVVLFDSLPNGAPHVANIAIPFVQ